MQIRNIDHWSVFVYILCHQHNFIKLYPSVDSHIFRRLYVNHVNKHILNLNKAIAIRFSQNKAWYPVLNTWYSLGKNDIISKDLSQFQWKSAHAPKNELPKDFL